MGAMYLVRFGRLSYDPVWTVDLMHFQAALEEAVREQVRAGRATSSTHSGCGPLTPPR